MFSHVSRTLRRYQAPTRNILARTANNGLSGAMSIGSDSAAYQGDGKTTVTVLNNSDPNLNFVNTYSQAGFRLQNNLFIYGSIILFPTHVFSWNVRSSKDINLDSLLLFDLVVPKIKIVVIGYGDIGEDYDMELPIRLKKKGISCEMLATPNAVTTYNYLVGDSVHAAGAFIPVRKEPRIIRKDVHELNKDLMNLEDENPINFISKEAPHTREPVSEYREIYQRTLGREMKKDKFDE